VTVTGYVPASVVAEWRCALAAAAASFASGVVVEPVLRDVKTGRLIKV